MREGNPVSIVGAGPSGALLAILLQRRGLEVTVFDSRPDPRSSSGVSGRSINLALADRGIHALKQAGVFETVADAMVPMRGRLIHHRDASRSLHLYGQRPSEIIYSISRHRLNQALLDVASGLHAVAVKFEHRLDDVDFSDGVAQILDLRTGSPQSVSMSPLLATDGAGSLVRHRMAAAGLIECRQADLEHGYKELSIPAGRHGHYVMPHDALHIWPRGNFMLIALPNIDGSFTATLFLAKRGPVSFETLVSGVAIDDFLRAEFGDVFALMPNRVAEFQEHPTGFLGTVYADKWNVGGSVALLGDAAHAIVPFHGQGMNCCFEDCMVFDACMQPGTTWESIFERYFDARKANTDAIAAMALENYLEMREHVAEPRFRLRQDLASELERRHPQRFIPRYSMVMFHHKISYSTAQRRGAIQSRLLADLTARTATLQDVDFQLADREINRLLPPILPTPGRA